MIAWFDIFSGISGDMTLGAFVDLGVPVDWLKKKLALLALKDFDIRYEHVWRNGIKAVNLFVDAVEDKNSHGHQHLCENAKQHENINARNYHDIKLMISDSLLPARVQSLSLAAFEKIARAESEIHGLDIENIHFHEVGGIDSIVDIVGSFLCVDFLGITDVYASTIPLGSGFVKCSHGILPVPVPAVMAILKEIPVKDSSIKMEIVTPTGAAIIATLVSEFGPMPDMVIDSIGYGSGKNTTDSDIPNLLRVVTGMRYNDVKSAEEKMTGQDTKIIREKIFVIETSIDDMIPEISGYLMEKLFEQGALDVCHIPVQMKKNRPGTKLEVLCTKDKLQNILNVIMEQSTTTGVRYHEVERACLKRKEISISTSFGTIKAKQIIDPAGRVRITPEYEVCHGIAEKKNIPLRDVYTQVYLDMNQSKL